MKRALPIFIFLLIFSFALFFVTQESVEIFETNEICFINDCFIVEIAASPEKQMKGLSFRESLEENKGMLFIFEKEGNYPFWMKNTLISLDIIWINKEKEVVFIKENALPCKGVNCPIIEPHQSAKYVLEVNSGASKAINLKIGDKAIFKF